MCCCGNDGDDDDDDFKDNDNGNSGEDDNDDDNHIPFSQKFQESTVNSNQDYLYLIILDDYLNFFLPSDGSGILSSSSKSKASVGSVRKGLSSR